MSRRGQASVEYMLLLCSVVCLALLVGAFMAKFGRGMVDDLVVQLLEAVIMLAMP